MNGDASIHAALEALTKVRGDYFALYTIWGLGMAGGLWMQLMKVRTHRLERRFEAIDRRIEAARERIMFETCT